MIFTRGRIKYWLINKQSNILSDREERSGGGGHMIDMERSRRIKGDISPQCFLNDLNISLIRRNREKFL